MSTTTTAPQSRVEVLKPAHGGRVFAQIGWRVNIDGQTAYSGDERGAKGYAREMRKREREGSLAEPAPTARDLYDALLALRKGEATPDETRAVMRRSRERNGAAEHERLKAVAVANLDRA